MLTFTTSDGNASASETITITVNANNHPPVAVAGGPYSGGTGLEIQFNGTGSSDPDGNNLTYAWDFGDGGTATGATPTHAYAFANNYLATLTVTDDGSPSLSDTDVASVSVLATIPASVTAKLYGGAFRIGGGGTQAMGLEITASRPPTDIDANTIRLSTTYPGAGTVSEIAPDPKTATIGDIDNDGVIEMDVAFTRAQLQSLLGNVPNGTVVTLVMKARTTAGTGAIPIQGSINVKIKSGGGHAVSSFASPNPFNPETAVNFTLKNSGPVTVRIYSLEGRLVKTLVNEFAAAGSHEVRWNGTDNTGRSVPSGMYFVKTESGADKSVVKLSLLK
jgi:PKD repeat protein